MLKGPDPVDWKGAALSCGRCSASARLETGQCGLGWSCLHDRYAKRIERFFVLNPDLADASLDHPYFETRMNAARVASVFRLPKLLGDPDPGVRAMAVLRLPRPYAERAMDDPDRRVRIAVANRVQPRYLLPMTDDGDAHVRAIVARRAPEGVLARMVGDADPEIRRIVARRLPPGYLDRFRADPDALVRREAASRRPGLFLGDPDMRVRHAAAENGDAAEVSALLSDAEEIIRETAAERLAQLKESL